MADQLSRSGVEVVELLGRFAPLKRGALVVPLGVSAAVLGLAAMSSASGRGATLLGFALLLALGAVYGVSVTRPRRLRIDRATGAVELDAEDGSSVRLPRSAIRWSGIDRQFQAAAPSDTSSTYFLLLHLRDGAALDLGGYSHDRANALSAQINGAMGDPRPGNDAGASGVDALRDVPGLVATAPPSADASGYRGDSPRPLELRWSSASRRETVALSLLGPAAFAALGYGWQVEVAPGGTPWIAGALLLVAAGAFVTQLLSLGTAVTVRVDEKTFSVTRTRGDVVLQRADLPVEAVNAVNMNLDTRQGLPALKVSVDLDRLQGAALPRGVAPTKLGGDGTHLRIPIPRLRLADTLRVDLALSAAVARHTGRAAGEV